MELEDNSKFCHYCGAKITKTVYCSKCGQQIDANTKFCPKCGSATNNSAVANPVQPKPQAQTPVQQTVQAQQTTPVEPPVQQTIPPVQQAQPMKPAKKSTKKILAIGGSCVALLLVGAIVFSMFFIFGKQGGNSAIYIKDGELYYSNSSKIEPWQITSNLFDTEIDDYNIFSDSNYVSLYTSLSEDGKILFYTDRINSNDSGRSLYFRHTDKPNDEPSKIDSEVKSFRFSTSGDRVAYLKGSDSILYTHNLTDKEKVDSDVDTFRMSKDGKKLCFLTNDDGLYLKNDGSDKEKIDSDVDSLSYITDDFSTIYYMSDDALYKKSEGKDKEKIADDVESVIKVYDSGEVYFYRGNDDLSKNLSEYIDDDMKDSDKNISKPKEPKTPSRSDYKSYSAYSKAYDIYLDELDEYNEKIAEYTDVANRNTLRDEYFDESFKIYNRAHSLCYFDGKTEKVLTEELSSDSYTASDENPILVFSIYDQMNDSKIKMSDTENISAISEIEDLISDKLFSSKKTYIAINGTMTAFESNEPTSVDFSSDGNTVYFLDDVSNSHGDLYKMSISGGKVEKPVLYDSNVYTLTYFAENGKYVYYKDVNNDKGELFVDKEKIDFDVNLYGSTKFVNDKIYYITDWNNDNYRGTLNVFSNGKKEKIADDAGDYIATPDNEVFYLYDYSASNYKGDLLLYKNGKSEKIDEDVTTLIHTYDSDSKNKNYY